MREKKTSFEFFSLSLLSSAAAASHKHVLPSPHCANCADITPLYAMSLNGLFYRPTSSRSQRGPIQIAAAFTRTNEAHAFIISSSLSLWRQMDSQGLSSSRAHSRLTTAAERETYGETRGGEPVERRAAGFGARAAAEKRKKESS